VRSVFAALKTVFGKFERRLRVGLIFFCSVVLAVANSANQPQLSSLSLFLGHFCLVQLLQFYFSVFVDWLMIPEQRGEFYRPKNHF